MNPIRSRKAAVALAATGLLAIGVIVPAIAQESADTTEQDETTPVERDETPPVERDATPPVERADRESAREEHHAAFVAALADELGLDVAEVDAAVTIVREQQHAERAAEWQARLEERLDSAVESGELTQDQADEILEGEADGIRTFLHGGHGGRHGEGSDGARGQGRGPSGGPGFGPGGPSFDPPSDGSDTGS